MTKSKLIDTSEECRNEYPNGAIFIVVDKDGAFVNDVFYMSFEEAFNAKKNHSDCIMEHIPTRYFEGRWMGDGDWVKMRV
jgi:hypothetical protein